MNNISYEINKLIIRDTIRLVDRIELVRCKHYLKVLGIKGYSKLSASDLRKMLVENLKKQNDEYILAIYNDNKVRLDMFKYELCETLKISSYRFDKEKDSFTVSGVQSVRAGGKTQQCAKFCRKEVYKKMLEE